MKSTTKMKIDLQIAGNIVDHASRKLLTMMVGAHLPFGLATSSETILGLQPQAHH